MPKVVVKVGNEVFKLTLKCSVSVLKRIWDV